MSAIDEKIKKLREQERQLGLEKRKIEFLNHILESAKGYDHEDFTEVKAEVVAMLGGFVTQAVHAIENNGKLIVTSEVQSPTTSQPALNTQGAETSRIQSQTPNEAAKPKSSEPIMSMNEKMNFALDNRHLAGKKVKVANDKNIDINGEVVGLDAPFVLVKTDTGPTIKVPLGNVSLK